jgi:hypothetical protein
MIIIPNKYRKEKRNKKKINQPGQDLALRRD